MPKKMYVGVNNVARQVKKGYFGVKEYELPTGYQQLDYVESSGAEYIDTGFVPDGNTRVVCDFQMMTAFSGSAGVFGARTSGTSQLYAFFHIGTNAFRTDYYGSVPQFSVTNDQARMTVDKNKNVTVMDGVTTTSTASTVSTGYSMWLFAVNNEGSLYCPATVRIYSCKIYDNGTLVRDFVPIRSAMQARVGLYDAVNGVAYYPSTGSLTAGNVIGSTARKIRKGYIGVGGVARPFLGEGKPEYYGTVTDLTYGGYNLAAASVGNYAIFTAAYYPGYSYGKYVTSYNKSLTKNTLTSLSNITYDMAGVSFGDYALFGGGENSGGGTTYTTVYAYDANLTRTNPTALSVARSVLKATTVGSYALFGGGKYYDDDDGYVLSRRIDVYNPSLTRTNMNATYSKMNYAAASVGDYALFGGGNSKASSNTYSQSATGVAYDTSLTESSLPTLPTAREFLSAARTGDYVLFAGGSYNESTSSVAIHHSLNEVTAYNKSLTLTTATALSVSRGKLAGVTLGGYALFLGGSRGRSYIGTKDVDMYDTALTRTVITNLATARSLCGATTVGDYALIAGGVGSSSSEYLSSVEAYALV